MVVVGYGMRHATGADLASWALKAAGFSCSTTTAESWFQSLWLFWQQMSSAAQSKMPLLPWICINSCCFARYSCGNNCNVAVKPCKSESFFKTHFTSVLRKQFAANDTFLRKANGYKRALALNNARQLMYNAVWRTDVWRSIGPTWGVKKNIVVSGNMEKKIGSVGRFFFFFTMMLLSTLSYCTRFCLLSSSYIVLWHVLL